jgi:hypothetical protein
VVTQVTQLSPSSWVYRFHQMVVGTAVVLPGSLASSVSTPGTITLEFCEVLLYGTTRCLRQHGYEANGTVDRYLVHGPVSSG